MNEESSSPESSNLRISPSNHTSGSGLDQSSHGPSDQMVTVVVENDHARENGDEAFLDGNKRKVGVTDEEYIRKRARNNIAVKKSRERSKRKILETQKRVEILTQENEELQTKVTLLTKELNVLRALFTNGGFTLPCDMQQSLSGSHSSPSSSYAASHSPSVIHHAVGSSFEVESAAASSKSAFRSLSDPHKLAPLRPTPMMARDLVPSPDMHHHESRSPRATSPISFTSRNISNYQHSSRVDPSHPPARLEAMAPNSVFSTVHRPSSLLKNIKKEEDLQSVVKNIIRPGPSSISTPPFPYNRRELDLSPRGLDSPQLAPASRQETSVIRNAGHAPEKTNDTASAISEALLGKFCVIQDPANSGQIKIVPIDG